MAPKGKKHFRSGSLFVRYAREQKEKAVLVLCSRSKFAKEVTNEMSGLRRETLYNWKRQLLAEGCNPPNKNTHGKTHLSIALGLKACMAGINVKFFTAANLANELIEAQDHRKLTRLERQIAKAELLIVDELSYLTFNRHQSELLFKVIADRSERQSVIVSTNLKFSDWITMFENTTMVTALIDRLTFRSHVLNMNSEHPYRAEHSAVV